jgi:hypothetical protein
MDWNIIAVYWIGDQNFEFYPVYRRALSYLDSVKANVSCGWVNTERCTCGVKSHEVFYSCRN